MQNTKYLKFLLFPIIIGIIGLFLTSVFWLGTPAESNSIQSDSPVKINPIIFNADTTFRDLEYQLRYNSITDKSIFKSQLLNLEDKFEREYLLALLEKRAEHYESTFEILMNLLSLSPNYYPYYDELADIANVTNNLGLLKKRVAEQKRSESHFLFYLSGIIFYKEGKFQNLFSHNVWEDNAINPALLY